MMRSIDSYIVSLFICIYVLLSPPFVFSEYIPFSVRICLEAVPAFLFILVLHSNKSQIFILLFVWVMLVLMMFLATYSQFISVAYSCLKIIFLFLMISLFDNKKTLFNLIKNFWFGFWLFVASSALISFGVYQMEIVHFEYLDFSTVTGSDSYHYYNNIFFGNIIQSHMFDIPVPRVTWYVFEPSILAFFFGLNVIVSDSFCVKKEYANKFKILNLFAGVVTFSNTFFIFFIFYGLFLFFNRGFLKYLFILLIPIFFVIVAWFINMVLVNPDIVGFTSLGDRLERVEIANYYISNNTLLSFLFGNGVGVSAEQFGRGISSGILTIFIERGFLVFSFLLYVFYKYTKCNKHLLIYLFFYSLTFELVWYPLLLLVISVVYRASYVKIPDILKVRFELRKVSNIRAIALKPT